jgi:hypothetical protein
MFGGWLLTGIFMIVQIAGKKRGCALERHSYLPDGMLNLVEFRASHGNSHFLQTGLLRRIRS